MADQQDWLSPCGAEGDADREQKLDPHLLGRVLREFRARNKMSQADLAQILNIDQSYVSKIEKGLRQVRDIELLAHVARQLDLPPEKLGIAAEAFRRTPSTAGTMVGAADPVAVSQDRWRATRRYLNQHGAQLARTAARLYRADLRLSGGMMISRPQWLPERPFPLSEMRLDWSDDAVGATISGGEPEAAGVLPLRAQGQRYPRYSSAMRYLDRPALFENRPSYRLLGSGSHRCLPFLRLGLSVYFDGLDIAEAIAHELALATNAATGMPDWADMPLRSFVGDPFELHRRTVLASVATLTLRRDRQTGRARFLLHWRDPAKVASGGGTYGLIPEGEFQPSSIATHDRRNDFDLWRNIVREYSEEMLGTPESDGSGGVPIDYDTWPLYRRMTDARDAGRITVHCLGLGVGALDLGIAVLTVAVFDDDVFDELFGAAVRVNAEGTLISAAGASKVTDGLPFDEETVTRLLGEGLMGSSGASILARAWTFRDLLLART